MPFTEKPTKMVYFDVDEKGTPFIEITTIDDRKFRYILKQNEWIEQTKS